ncbi:MAG: alpha/beta fold hydrolase [Gemmatimonadetes bacterium]|nr:alpha/beta fold hydrolase [Gemmatimonadota bacterium]
MHSPSPPDTASCAISPITLSRRGIAVLRLDDRGVGESTAGFEAATTASLAEDARVALRFLSARADIDAGRLGIVGHSEGGMIAPMVAADGPPLRVIVLMAGPSRPGRRILEHQLRRNIEQDPSLSAARRDSAVAGIPAMIESLAADQWMRYFLGYDPVPALRQVRVPVLVLQGATDRQVTADQAEEIAAALRAGGNERVTVRVLPDINHLFLRDPNGYPQGYAALGPTLPDEVLGTLADWLASELVGLPRNAPDLR